MKLLTKEALPKAIESITKRGKVLDTDIHIAACSAIALRAESGDTAWINRLYLALPKGTRAVALTAWLLKFGGVIANDGSTGKPKGEQPFLHTKDKAVDVVAGWAEPWYDFKPDQKPDEVFDVLAVLMGVLKKAKGKELAHGEMLSGIQALIESAAKNAAVDAPEPEAPADDTPPVESSSMPTHDAEGNALVDVSKGLIGGVPAAEAV
jgi:hypothetical protein